MYWFISKSKNKFSTKWNELMRKKMYMVNSNKRKNLHENVLTLNVWNSIKWVKDDSKRVMTNDGGKNSKEDEIKNNVKVNKKIHVLNQRE